MTCSHTKKAYKDHWYCKRCGEPVEVEAKPGMPRIYAPTKDINDDTDLGQLRHHEWPSHWSGSRCEREIKKVVDDARQSRRQRPEGTKLKARLPMELYLNKRKRDPAYWSDDKNLNRHTDFLVDK